MNLASFFTLLFIGFGMPFFNNGISSSKEEDLVDQIQSKVIATIEKQYPLHSCGSGAAMPDGPIRELTLCFSSKNLNRDELRFMLVRCAQELLREVQSTNGINDYLYKPPFKISDIQIIIYNHDKDGRELLDPLIGSAEISRGILTYDTVDPINTLRYKNTFSETYEEALKILEKP